MSYKVLWLPGAEQELAAIWLDSASREAVRLASHELDKRLKANGPDEGESREEGLRLAFAGPLGILFGVDESNRLIQVVHVWEFEQQGS